MLAPPSDGAAYQRPGTAASKAGRFSQSSSDDARTPHPLKGDADAAGNQDRQVNCQRRATAAVDTWGRLRTPVCPGISSSLLRRTVVDSCETRKPPENRKVMSLGWVSPQVPAERLVSFLVSFMCMYLRPSPSTTALGAWSIDRHGRPWTVIPHPEKADGRRSAGQRHASGHRLADVTVIVTKTPRSEPDVVSRAETARCRRLRRAEVCATGRDGLGRRPPDS